jgi:hypothetical protein
MGRAERQLEEDKAMRKSAFGLFRSSLDHVRGEITPGSLGKRSALRLYDGLAGYAEDGVSAARKKPKTIGALAAVAGIAVAAWFARKPLLEMLEQTVEGVNLEDLSDIEWHADEEPREVEDVPE